MSSVSSFFVSYFFTMCATKRRLCSISLERASLSPSHCEYISEIHRRGHGAERHLSGCGPWAAERPPPRWQLCILYLRARREKRCQGRCAAGDVLYGDQAAYSGRMIFWLPVCATGFCCVYSVGERRYFFLNIREKYSGLRNPHRFATSAMLLVL